VTSIDAMQDDSAVQGQLANAGMETLKKKALRHSTRESAATTTAWAA
jgi:hypothetical protein